MAADTTLPPAPEREARPDDLARRLVAHPQWTWAAGMLVRRDGVPARLAWRDNAYWHASYMPERSQVGGWLRIRHDRMAEEAPDLADAATTGVLLDALGSRLFSVHRYANGRIAVGYWTTGGAILEVSGRSLGEAAARAWLAANEGAVGAGEGR